MIDPHWSVVDLDPHTWRALGRFIDPGQYIQAAQPGEHGLFVLHDNSRLLRIIDSERGVRTDLEISSVEDPGSLARHLYEQGDWQRVHVINKRHLEEVARLAQQIPDRPIYLDAYYRRIYHLLWQSDDRYACQPPHPGHWHGWTYQGILDFVHTLPAATTLALGVFEDTALEIGLILEWHEGKITKVTTFEALPDPSSITGVSAEILQNLWQQLSTQFAPPAGVLLCTRSVFERWIETAEDKYSLLQDAQECGQALWRLER